MTRILIVDDHPLACEGLRAMLDPPHDVVGCLNDASEVMAAVASRDPDVVLLDLCLGRWSGVDLARRIHRSRPWIKIGIVSMYADHLLVDEAQRAGVLAYILKLATRAELLAAVAAMLHGHQFVDPRLARLDHEPNSLPDQNASAVVQQLRHLSRRQRQVLDMIVAGRTTNEIASELGVTTKAIEYHRDRLRRTLGVGSTAALVRLVLETREAEASASGTSAIVPEGPHTTVPGPRRNRHSAPASP